jgi:lysophospholipase L1-like esterase
MTARRRRVLRLALAVLLTPLVLLALAEFAAGLTRQGNAVIFVEDPDMYIVRPANTEGYTWGGDRWFACRINNVNLRGEDVPPVKAEGERRILCLGDSFTFGSGVEEPLVWPQHLQTLVGPVQESRVRVMNAGSNGWGTAWQRLYLERRGMPQTQPDIVVLGWNWNDVGDDPDAGPAAVRHFIRAEGSWLEPVASYEWVRMTHLFRWLFTRRVLKGAPMTPASRLAVLDVYRREMDRRLLAHEREVGLVAAVAAGRVTEAQDWRRTDTRVWQSVLAEFGRLRYLCSQSGATLVVALLPEPSWNGPGRFPPTPRLTSALDVMRLPWVDVQPDFLTPRTPGQAAGRDESLWLDADPVHPSAAGHAIIARRVLETLREQQLLP